MFFVRKSIWTRKDKTFTWSKIVELKSNISIISYHSYKCW